MVLFSDFGDSALVFKLRVWTLIDYGLTTETELRFEIDRIFREKKITIAFPQLDVHFHPKGNAGQHQSENSVFS
jgi:small-conductance mechanosensitive channel